MKFDPFLTKLYYWFSRIHVMASWTSEYLAHTIMDTVYLENYRKNWKLGWSYSETKFCPNIVAHCKVWIIQPNALRVYVWSRYWRWDLQLDREHILQLRNNWLSAWSREGDKQNPSYMPLSSPCEFNWACATSMTTYFLCNWAAYVLSYCTVVLNTNSDGFQHP